MISFRYDQEVNALSIRLTDGLVVRTATIDDGTLVDLDQHGEIVAVEVIRPARPWPLSEIIARFSLEASAVSVLESLWGEANKGYPFAAATPTSA